ncbi:outer membrane protein assembly factor BamB family protein [Rubinisphaera italica]|uniref:Outer membrane biogenesis protein BamB n=1 Tax=Rubinisphaera italica TaxID=2527969 RepID=A0A5C5XJU0_9PLAN|nr:PQQ-binding-like beta-propeller repeat protein [Rubinisphaera italica]TWT63250.1 outer membrane biogenesis protein BamB [Rubinisphaera italica]
MSFIEILNSLTKERTACSLNFALSRICWLCVALLIFSGLNVSISSNACFAQPQENVPDFFSETEEDPDDASMWYLVQADNEFRRKFESLETLISEDRAIDAAVALQAILDNPADFLIMEESGKSDSLKLQMLSWVEELPNSILAAYNLKYDPQCRHLIAQYDKSGQLHYLLEASRRFLHTNSGGIATFRLASHYYDRGDFRTGCLYYLRLQEVERHANQFSPWLELQTSICLANLYSAKVAIQYLQEHVQQSPMNVGGEPITFDKLQEMLAESINSSPDTPQIAEDPEWRNFRRTAERNRYSSEFNMLPLIDWKIDASEVLLDDTLRHTEAFRALLKGVSRGVRERNFVTLPAPNPIVTKNHILVAGFGSMAAFDRQDGSLLWKSSTTDRSLEFLLNEEMLGRFGVDARPDNELHHYAIQHLFCDLTTGTLSSDGNTVFAVRNTGLASLNARTSLQVSTENHALIPTESNLLSAFDIETGKLIWEVGRSSNNMNANLLTGHYFLGPPVTVQGRLFVQSENGSQMFLIELDAATGEAVWIQPLAHPELEITADRPRRIAGTMPTYAAPYLICPTNAGSVMAVDIGLREIGWISIYAVRKPEQLEYDLPFGRRHRDPSEDRRQIDFTGGRYMDGSHWQETVPLMVDQTVLLTPIDSRDLIALDVMTGQVRWVEPRRDGMYAEVTPDGQILIVGNTVIRSLTQSGLENWRRDLISSEPAGRGVFRNSIYQLALKNGELLSIDVKTGHILASTIPEPDLQFGNLLAVDDQLFSFSTGQLIAFASLADVKKRINSESEQNPEAIRLSLSGQLELHQGNTKLGLEYLQQSYIIQKSPEIAKLITQTLLDADHDVLNLDSDTISELAELMVSADHAPEVVFRYVDALLHMERPLEAFRVIHSLLVSQEQTDALMILPGERRATLSAYATGFIQELHEDGTSNALASLVKESNQIIEQTTDAAKLQKLSPLFAVEALEPGYRLQLCRLLNPQLNALLLEKHLSWLEQHASDAQRPEVMARMAELFLQNQKWEAAREYVDQLASNYQETICLNEKTGQQLLNEWKTAYDSAWEATPNDRLAPVNYSYQVTSDPEAAATTRGDHPVTIEKRLPSDSPWKYWLFSMERIQSQLIARNVQDNPAWRLNLGEIGRSSQNFLHSCGHLGIFQSEGELFGFNTLTGETSRPLKPMWSATYGESSTSGSRGFMITSAMQTLGLTPLKIGWQEESGHLAQPVDFHLPMRDRDRIVLYDLINGKPRWEIKHPEEDDIIVWANEQSVFLIDSHGDTYAMHRFSDGALLTEQALPRHDELRALSGSIAVLWERIDQQSGRLIGFDLQAQAILWSLDVSGSVSLAALDSEKLVLLDVGQNSVRFLDPKQESPVFFQTDAPQTNARLLYVLEDEQCWYVHITTSPESVSQNLGFESGADINGPMFAVDKKTQQVLWNAEVDRLRWIPGQPARLPFLVYGAKVEISTRDENGEQQIFRKPTLQVIDKATGKTITNLPEEVNGLLVKQNYNFEQKKFDLEFTSGTLSIQAIEK